MPALRRRDDLRLHDPAALRRHGGERDLFLGLGHRHAGREAASEGASQLHVAEQTAGAPLSNGRAAVKFNSFWTVELEEGWSLFAIHPANREDLPFRTVSGMVDCDRFHDAGINFPAIWTDARFEGVLPAGTPVAQCFPVRRTAFDMVVESFDEAATRQYDETVGAVLEEPGVYRKRFRDKRTRSSAKEGFQG